MKNSVTRYNCSNLLKLTRLGTKADAISEDGAGTKCVSDQIGVSVILAHGQCLPNISWNILETTNSTCSISVACSTIVKTSKIFVHSYLGEIRKQNLGVTGVTPEIGCLHGLPPYSLDSPQLGTLDIM